MAHSSCPWLAPSQLGHRHPNTRVGVTCHIRCSDLALKLLKFRRYNFGFPNCEKPKEVLRVLSYCRFLHTKYTFAFLVCHLSPLISYCVLAFDMSGSFISSQLECTYSYRHITPRMFTMNKFSETPFMFRKCKDVSTKIFCCAL